MTPNYDASPSGLDSRILRGPETRSPNALDSLEKSVLAANGSLRLTRISGAVTEVVTSHYRVSGLSPFLKIGQLVEIDAGDRFQLCEAVRIENESATLKPFDSFCSAGLGATAILRERLFLSPHAAWKGRVINSLGAPLDGKGDLPHGERTMFVDREPDAAMMRGKVNRPIRTGIRVVDIFTPLCAGQRIGIFAGSGVGKSSLLAMLARAPDFDTVVVALVGERGREVREFLDGALGDRRNSTVAVVSTGGESPMMRRLAARTAMTVSEYFRDCGQSVLLIVDSVTRFAHAARDVAIAAGEPPVARGYTPSVFNDLPRLLERAGPGSDASGSITGVFSVLVDGDDHNDPIADSIRGTLDGHIVLDRAIAEQGRYPAVDIMSSISRIAHPTWTEKHRALVAKLKLFCARFEETRDLRLMGGYTPGSDPTLDQALRCVPKIYEALTQSTSDSGYEDPFVVLATALKGEEKSNGGDHAADN